MTARAEVQAGMLARVRELADLRSAAASQAAELKALREGFEAECAPLIASVRRGAEMVASAETALKAVVTARFAEDGERSPAPGVVVKDRQTMEYDETEAFEWAKSTRLALVPESLDTKAFAKIAKAAELSFVKYGTEPMVTIATDLSKALAEVAA